jgi:hypothetical protein
MRADTRPPVTDSARPSDQPSAQQVEHDRLHRVGVDAEHEVAELVADLGSHSRGARSPRRRWPAFAVRRTFSPSQPLARNASVGLPTARRARRSRRRGARSARSRSRPRCAARGSRSRTARRCGAAARGGCPLEHVVHLVGTPGTANTTLSTPVVDRDRADEPGRGAARLRDDGRADGHHRLAQVVLGHPAAAAREHLTDHVGHRLVELERRPSPRRSPHG